MWIKDGRLQHHGENGLQSRPSSPYLENVKLKLWKAKILQQKILANQVIRGRKMSLGNTILYFAWAGGQTGALSVTLPVCGNTATLVLEASFNNSKYFKTAVKSTVTFPPKIVSCEKNIFLKVHSSHHLYVYIHIFKKITLKARWDWEQQGVWSLGRLAVSECNHFVSPQRWLCICCFLSP